MARPPIRILIVDDVPQVRQDLHLLLDLGGCFEVVGEASNGLEAVAAAAALEPQLILIDLEMPVMDGYEAARLIKAHSPGCRVIALSVHAGPQSRQRAGLSGMDGFIEKGISFETVLQGVIFEMMNAPSD